MSIYLARNGKMLTRLNGTRYFGSDASPVPPTPTEVTIGTQTWMSTNLAIDDGQGGIYSQTVNYGHGNVVEYYYTWDAAMRLASSIDGWHLPNYSDWTTLIHYVGTYEGRKLKSTYGWSNYGSSSGNGTDDYGFCALPAGYIDGTLYGLYEHAVFWSSTESSSSTNKAVQMDLDTDPYASFGAAIYKYWMISVRLVKD